MPSKLPKSSSKKTRNIQLCVEYDGTNFNGWQIQKGKGRTVQEELVKACNRITSEHVTITGSGRTDSGVHALGQVAHFKTTSSLSATELQKALNANLPEDVAVTGIREVRNNFHSQYSAKEKTYRYTIYTAPVRPVICRNFVLYYPFPLNVARMKKEARSLLGRKDFKSFQAKDTALRGKPEKNTIRKITKIAITTSKNVIQVDITANGFLYKMVRNIVGTLIEIGTGKLPQGSMSRILKAKDRAFAGKTAPAKGLCLLSVRY